MADRGTDEADLLSWGDYISVLDYFGRNQVPVVSMLGGEPTLHPEVADFCRYALLRGFDVRIFTSGIMAPAQHEALMAVAKDCKGPKRLRFIVNVNEPRDDRANESDRQRELFAWAGSRASLSFNIYRVDFDVSFALDLIQRYGLHKSLRFGLTHPASADAAGIPRVLPGDLRAVGDQIARFLDRIDEQRVAPDLDCGFPICMFSDEQLGKLMRLRTKFQWTCGPIVDIGPDLTVWPCFPLWPYRWSLFDFESLEQLRRAMLERIRQIAPTRRGLYPECATCRWRDRGLCSAGCRGHQLPTGAGS
jgi:hypothetical protein